MTEPAMFWHITDSRTGQQLSIAAYRSKEQAELAMQSYRDRDAKGKRPDFHPYIPFMEARPWSVRGW